MSEYQPWLGICHLTKEEGETQENYTAIAAVFCRDHNTYDALLRRFLDPKGYRLLWSEEVYPAGQWMSRHPRERDTIALAPKVHEGHRVEVDLIRSTGTGGGPTEPESYLIVEEIEGVEPLDGQVGAWPLKNVPDALMEPIFGDVEPTEAEIEEYGSPEAVPPMKTYAILDAGKIIFGLSVIEECNMPFRCLFKGDAAEELQDVAPYIIELSPDRDFTRTLFTHNPAFPDNHSTVHLWHKEPGIYIRSRATLDDLWKYFRKFTRIQDENGKWYFFRFWEPRNFKNLMKLVGEDGASNFLSLTHSAIVSYHLCEQMFITERIKHNYEGLHRNKISISSEMKGNIKRLNHLNRSHFLSKELSVSCDLYHSFIQVSSTLFECHWSQKDNISEAFEILNKISDSQKDTVWKAIRSGNYSPEYILYFARKMLIEKGVST